MPDHLASGASGGKNTGRARNGRAVWRVMNPDERPSKRDAFLAFLHAGWVSLHLDARRPGVVVPPSLAGEAHLVLQYGRNMPIPIPDLEVTESGVSATLSFSRNPQRTHIPWHAVYGVECTDGRGVLYQEDVPAEVSLVAAADDEERRGALAAGSPAPPPGTEPPRRTPPQLRSVPADEAPPPEVEPAAAPRRRRKPQLRVVK